MESKNCGNKLPLPVACLFFCLLAHSLWGCGNGEKEWSPQKFEVSVSGGAVPFGGGDVEITVSCGGEWRIEEIPEWCEVEALSGSGDRSLTVTVDENTEYGRHGYLTVSSGVISTGCVIAQQGIPGSIRVLVVGNSFSVDALTFVPGLAAAEGLKFIFGNLYIGGAGLNKHTACIKNDSREYEYTAWRSSTSGEVTKDTAISDVIDAEAWDYIVLQEVSGASGIYDYYFPNLTYMMNYLRANCLNPDMKFVFHQTWAYPQNSTHSAFPNYGSDQMNMYGMIVETIRRVVSEAGIDILIPSATAIQNGRTSELGDTFNRDSNHLNYTYGRYTAACVWFETLFGVPVAGNAFVPATVTPRQAEIAKAAAHYAILDPDRVTDMSGFGKY